MTHRHMGGNRTVCEAEIEKRREDSRNKRHSRAPLRHERKAGKSEIKDSGQVFRG